MNKKIIFEKSNKKEIILLQLIDNLEQRIFDLENRLNAMFNQYIQNNRIKINNNIIDINEVKLIEKFENAYKHHWYYVLTYNNNEEISLNDYTLSVNEIFLLDQLIENFESKGV